MGVATGLTAAAMQAIIDGTIISADVDEANHLILTLRDNSTLDAGEIGADATTLTQANLYADQAATTAASSAESSAVSTANTYTDEQIAGLGQDIWMTEAIGSIKLWSGALPSGAWKECDGTAYSRTTYAFLFAQIGTTFGAGDGSTTFNVPNFQNRFPIGAGSTYSDGQTGGTTSHTHALSSNAWAMIRLAASATLQVLMRRITVSSWTATHELTPSATQATSNATASTTAAELGGATDSATHLPPYLGVRFIIKVAIDAAEVPQVSHTHSDPAEIEPALLAGVSKVRLTATGDVSATSTGHALQIGPDNGLNMAFDQNEIMVRNNGVGQPLYVEFGVTVAGALLMDGSEPDTRLTDKAYVDGLVEDSGWVNITFTSGFASYSSFTCRVRRIGKVVYSEGLIYRTAGAWAANTVYADVALIPSGYRPSTSGQQFFASATNTGGTDAASIVIDQTGTIGLRTMNEAGNYYSLAGLCWLAD